MIWTLNRSCDAFNFSVSSFLTSWLIDSYWEALHCLMFSLCFEKNLHCCSLESHRCIHVFLDFTDQDYIGGFASRLFLVPMVGWCSFFRSSSMIQQWAKQSGCEVVWRSFLVQQKSRTVCLKKLFSILTLQLWREKLSLLQGGRVFHSQDSEHRSLPDSVSGRGVRLISSATVKGEGGGETGGGYKHLVLNECSWHSTCINQVAPQTRERSFVSIRGGRHARLAGSALKRDFEDSNQTCWDTNTAASSNLVRKIRYDYRERAETVRQAKQSASARRHFKVNQCGEVVDFGERWVCCGAERTKEEELKQESMQEEPGRV